MAFNISRAILYTLAIPLLPATCCGASFAATELASYDPRDIIERDIIVIGGGSSGTYSSIRLKDHNKTIVMIEKQAQLGGHAEAWVEPSTGAPFDIGVVVFARSNTATDYFARFNLSLTPIESASTSEYVEFSTGKVIDFVPPSQEALTTVLSAYLDQLYKYPALQDGFKMTYPVESDLLLSFGEFITQYRLEDLVFRAFLVNQGAAPLLDISMLYIFKYLNSDEVDSLERSFLTTQHHSTTELYRNAAEYLGSDVLLNSTVLAMDRSRPEEARVAVQTSSGPKLLIAKRILSTIPPLLENMDGYDLSEGEKSLFRKFFANGYYTCVLNNTGLDKALIATGPGQPYGMPVLPGIYSAYPIPVHCHRRWLLREASFVTRAAKYFL
ncbi:putative Amine oxidase domain-containing protein [Seiridium cardinale]|uniref:Amine oxidase domain-containing protein n=1 Tax=Seiridium cardinale TaxID=138064 RepID=A0ABR2XP32_9PEZI